MFDIVVTIAFWLLYIAAGIAVYKAGPRLHSMMYVYSYLYLPAKIKEMQDAMHFPRL